MSFGNIIKDLRFDKNLSQQTVADRIKISRSVLSQYENNLVEPTINVVRNLAIFFEVSASYLLELEDDFGTAVIQPTSEALTKEERDIIENYRELNFAGKKLIKQTLNTLIESTNTSSQSKKKFNSDKK